MTICGICKLPICGEVAYVLDGELVHDLCFYRRLVIRLQKELDDANRRIRELEDHWHGT